MTTTTMTLTEFLLARIAEDEVAAQDALERGFGGWEYFADRGVNYEARTHIARYHPVRVLAECEAKRRIVQECGWAYRQVQESGLNVAMRILAAVYADHPDYRDEWRA